MGLTYPVKRPEVRGISAASTTWIAAWRRPDFHISPRKNIFC